MSLRGLVVFEDGRWPALGPLADLTPVPALRFGASTLAGRWVEFSALPLLGIESRLPIEEVWGDARSIRPRREAAVASDTVIAVSAAALPGPWFADLVAADGPLRVVCGGRLAAVGAPHAELALGLGRGAGFESFLGGLKLPERETRLEFLERPWDLVARNALALAADLGASPGALEGRVDPRAVLHLPERIVVEEGARVDALAVLDAREGPVRIAAGAVVTAHTVVTGPCLVGEGTHLLGGLVARSTIGPGCRIAGEVEECLWQGWANKRHHGFVGHSAIGEWVNLGALTTTSDLKNNYGEVRAWSEGEMRPTGLTKLGALIGAHVKTGIGTLLPTGASVGAGANLFGGGRFAPRRTAPFAWWDGERLEEHRLEAMLATARTAASRRDRALSAGAERMIREHFSATTGERAVAAGRV